MADFSEKQRKAIGELEAAFKACARAGLVFYGMDQNLYVLTKKSNDLIGQPGQPEDYCSIARTDGWENVDEIVKTHNAYKDSGAF